MHLRDSKTRNTDSVYSSMFYSNLIFFVLVIDYTLSYSNNDAGRRPSGDGGQVLTPSSWPGGPGPGQHCSVTTDVGGTIFREYLIPV